MSQQIANIPATPATPAAAAPATPLAKKSTTSWAVAAVLVAGILTLGIPLGIAFVMWNRAAVDAPRHLGDAMRSFATEVLQPRGHRQRSYLRQHSGHAASAKLVVLQTTVDADVTRERASGWGMYWGTNVARVAVRGAHVQYAIDLSSLGTSDFTYNESARTSPSRSPRHLDTAMIAIDPGQIQTLDLRGGWMQLEQTGNARQRDRRIEAEDHHPGEHALHAE